jgi:hypothetical protein
LSKDFLFFFWILFAGHSFHLLSQILAAVPAVLAVAAAVRAALRI